jgi:uncharacterized membrane protein YeaQ/YmgE (transglycosylase-associated protein family)
MIAIGCLAPIILGVVGVLAGNAMAGSMGAIWGGVAGLFGGGLILGAVGWIASQMKE